MGDKETVICLYCKSTKVIKHGKTSNGNIRYRCRTCGRTWVHDRAESRRPDLAEVVEAYLSGKTYRQLVDVYHSSPLRINQKIREFLGGCPSWEEYLDSCVQIHEPRLVYLVGREFSSATKGSQTNTSFFAMAIDSLSTVVLGFEIADKESPEVWENLLQRMLDRGFTCTAFMAKGSRFVEESVEKIFPNASFRISYHITYRDNELACCLGNNKSNSKLINDALHAYDLQKDKSLLDYLSHFGEDTFRKILLSNSDIFFKRLKERMDNRPKIRVDGLTNAFQARFEKFHMLKDDPYPVINGWIARWMLHRLDFGFSRLAVYMQVPSVTTFKAFSCGNQPLTLSLNDESMLLKNFVIELAARSLQIPVFYFKCEMKLDKCSLF
jgi:hypothetical protein